VAESEPEYEMFVCRHGPLHAWLKDQRDMSDCGLGSPVQHLDRCGCLGSDLLAVHANYLWQEDPRLLAQRGVSVVHCPRSHAYFGHRRFPRESLTQASVNICLGTDSLATVIPEPRRAAELSLFAEMQALAAQARAPAPETILQMATVNGARALGRPAELGELSAGALADLIAIPFSGPPANALEAVVHHTGPVTASMIAGQWALTPSGA
jgi:cytosine/adenosine deaminase-related metal-dependent hydrolase